MFCLCSGSIQFSDYANYSNLFDASNVSIRNSPMGCVQYLCVLWRSLLKFITTPNSSPLCIQLGSSFCAQSECKICTITCSDLNLYIWMHPMLVSFLPSLFSYFSLENISELFSMVISVPICNTHLEAFSYVFRRMYRSEGMF